LVRTADPTPGSAPLDFARGRQRTLPSFLQLPGNADAVQKKRAEILKKLKVISKKEMKSQTFRAQYKGYRDIDGVAPDSETETYFKIRASLSSSKWKDVPIVIESGKRLGDPVKEIVVTFKHPMPCLCPPGEHHKNEVIIRSSGETPNS